MSRIQAESFLQIDEADLAAYADARASEMGLIIATSFKPSVIENLTALHAHAQRVSAALQDLDGATAEAGAR